MILKNEKNFKIKYIQNNQMRIFIKYSIYLTLQKAIRITRCLLKTKINLKKEKQKQIASETVSEY
jgi:hypothetical protein